MIPRLEKWAGDGSRLLSLEEDMRKKIGFTTIICGAIGAGFGYALDNPWVGLIYGLLFGAALGAILDRRINRSTNVKGGG